MVAKIGFGIEVNEPPKVSVTSLPPPALGQLHSKSYRHDWRGEPVGPSELSCRAGHAFLSLHHRAERSHQNHAVIAKTKGDTAEDGPPEIFLGSVFSVVTDCERKSPPLALLGRE